MEHYVSSPRSRCLRQQILPGKSLSHAEYTPRFVMPYNVLYVPLEMPRLIVTITDFDNWIASIFKTWS
jgi:hypothetical protein